MGTQSRNQLEFDKLSLPFHYCQHNCFQSSLHTKGETTYKIARSAVSSAFNGLHGQELIVAVNHVSIEM